MNAGEETPPRDQGVFSLLGSMARTRVELAALELEDQVRITAGALMLSVAALVLGLVAFTFLGVAVIAIFWDTHRVWATIGTTLAYLSLAALLIAVARARWRSRPPAFAATLHELDKDRAALGSQL
jgi:uncharacterized membrane protein YqjE